VSRTRAALLVPLELMSKKYVAMLSVKGFLSGTPDKVKGSVVLV
jgi:hypothetical protein